MPETSTPLREWFYRGNELRETLERAAQEGYNLSTVETNPNSPYRSFFERIAPKSKLEKIALALGILRHPIKLILLAKKENTLMHQS